MINPTIAVIGAGPGGLTLARLLQRAGADVTVYERDAGRDARARGATLDLHDESGLKALREAGLEEEFRAAYRPGAERTRVMDQNARILWDEHAGADTEASRPEIDRGPLQDLLLDSLRPGTVVWGRRFEALSPRGDAWEVRFADGASVLAGLVVAADGANSRVRPSLTPIRPFYCGVTVVEGAVSRSETACPRMHRLLKGGKIFAFGGEKSMIVSSKGDDGLVFYAGVKTDESWGRDSGIDFGDNAQVCSWFDQEYADWDGVWRELLAGADAGFVARPQRCVPLDQTWGARPDLTLLGDAAHLMPPYAGEGVNMAMLDALELSECLTGGDFADARSAIAAYETRMRSRAAIAARASLESLAALHSPDAIPYLLNVFAG